MSRHISLCRDIISREMTELGHDIFLYVATKLALKYDLARKCLSRH